MATISTAIELNDNFTGVLNNIVNAMNMTVSVMEQMQGTMNDPVDPSALDGIRNYANQATIAVQDLTTALGTIEPPAIPTPSAPKWQSDTMDVFTNTGVERYKQEVQSANNMLNTLNQTQERIVQAAADMDFLPPGGFTDLSNMQAHLQAIQQRIQAIQNSPLNMGSNAANVELEQLRGQLNQAVRQQEMLNQAVENMDIESANAAYLQLSQTVGSAERQIRNNIAKQDEFNSAITEGCHSSDKLLGKIKSMVAAYVSVQAAKKAFELSDEITQTTARLNLMNDGLQSTQDLFDMTFAAAQRSRGSLQSMTNVVARFGNNAKDAFSSNREVIAFSELIQKQMTIAGAGTQEANNAMLQLSQAMGSGVLRGDELNSIFEQAPNIIQRIADYLDVPIGSIREMAQEGKLTAATVKAAVFASADDINDKFNSMPMTWGQIWQSMQNKAIMAFKPVLDKLNELANNEEFQRFVDNAINALSRVAEYVLAIIDTVASVCNFISSNWDTIAPIISMAAVVFLALAVAIGVANAAQVLFNTTLFGCPLIWILAIIIVAIVAFYALIDTINKLTDSSISATGIIAGAFLAWGACILNKTIIPLQQKFAAFANFIGNFANDPIAAVKVLFYDMCLTVLGYISNVAHGIEDLINAIPGISVNITGGIDDLYSKIEEAQQKVKDESGWVEYVKKWDYIDITKAFNVGYDFGEKLEKDISGLFDPSDELNKLEETLNKAASIDENTGAIKDSMDITEEDLKYLRDIAEQETINRFTTAEITVEQHNTNNISSKMDLDGVIDGLTDAVDEAVFMITEGVHV